MPHHASRVAPPLDGDHLDLANAQGMSPADRAAAQAAPPASRGTPFWRFCLVGGIGFVTDTGILLALVHGAGLGPVPAKILSFGAAVVVTFQINRLWAFGATRHGSLWRAFATYLWVQGAGAACNLAVFTTLSMRLPKSFDSLLLCAAVAAAAALLVNYLGASRLVFAAARAVRPDLLKP